LKYFVTKSTRDKGYPPGTPVPREEGSNVPVKIEIIDYNEAGHTEKTIDTAEQCHPFKENDTVTWLNITGVHDVQLLEKLGEIFGLHPLVLEDISHTEQRPKVEDYDDYIYIVFKMIQIKDGTAEIEMEQVSLILGNGFVISFQEREGDVFDPVRDRIRQGKGRIRRMGADYLCYALLDSTVDGYFVSLEEISNEGEGLQEKAMEEPEPETLQQIHHLKQQLISFRRAVWPLRESINELQRGESPLIRSETQPYFRDIYDHTIQVMDTVEVFRELIASITDMYMNTLSNRMNEVMKVLTIMASIFIPLTFIAGVYGMNFEHMPELHWKWAYPAALSCMGIIAIGMLTFFRRRKWI
jgi:magnesium transporter